MNKAQFFVVKLKTGETLFAEVLEMDDMAIHMANPWEVTSAGESLSASEWMPYVDQEVYQVPISMCYFIGTLNKKFTQFYGSIVLQSEINKIKKEVYDSMNDRNDHVTMVDGVYRMKEVAKNLQAKYGLDNESLDFSDFDKALEKHKPVMH